MRIAQTKRSSTFILALLNRAERRKKRFRSVGREHQRQGNHTCDKGVHLKVDIPKQREHLLNEDLTAVIDEKERKELRKPPENCCVNVGRSAQRRFLRLLRKRQQKA